MPSRARQSHELLGTARRGAGKARAGSAGSGQWRVLPKSAIPAGSECSRRRKGSLSTSARARCASFAHARPRPPSEHDWRAGIARPRVAGFRADPPSAQDGDHSGGARPDGAELSGGRGQAAGHGAARLAAELLSDCCVQGVSGAPRSSARLHRFGCSLHRCPVGSQGVQWPSQLWVLRSTITLKTTDTTLVSVDGANDHRGALVHLSHDSPETITEETPSATVTPTQSHGRGKARPRS